MRNYLQFLRYHLIVVILYLLLIPAVYIISPFKLHYTWTSDHAGLIISIIAITFIGFYYLVGPKFDKSAIGFFQVVSALLYAAVFAIPEEIIFRDLIQSFLAAQLNNIALVILVSSLIFGTVHLANNAKGFHPNAWNWKFFGLTFLAGLPLGLIFSLTKSLLVPTVLHTLLVMGLILGKEKERL